MSSKQQYELRQRQNGIFRAGQTTAEVQGHYRA